MEMNINKYDHFIPADATKKCSYNTEAKMPRNK